MFPAPKRQPVRWAGWDPISRWERLTATDLSVEQSFLYLIVLSTVLAQMGELSVGGFSFRGWAWVIVLVVCAFF